MKKFRAVTEKTTTQRAVIEFEARDITVAAIIANRFTEETRIPRGVTLAQPYDSDQDQKVVESVVSIKET